MEQERGFIKYIVIIAVILVVAFLSQQAYVRATGQNFISGASSKASEYLAKGSNWVSSKVVPEINGGVQNGGEVISTAVDQGKKVPESFTKKIGNYFSGISDAILHPGENNNCPVPATSTSTKP